MILTKDIERARLYMSIAVLLAAMIAFAWGWRAAVSALLGGSLSLVNFYWLLAGASASYLAAVRAVDEPDSAPPPTLGAAWAITRFLFRYPPLFIAGYAIVSCSFIRREAFVLALLAPVAGIFAAAIAQGSAAARR